MIKIKSLLVSFAGLLVLILSSFAGAGETTSTVTHTGLSVSDYTNFSAEEKVDVEALKNTEGNEVVTETLDDGRQIVTIKSKGEKADSSNMDSGRPPQKSDINNSVTLYLDKDGKLQAKSISQEVNGKTTTSTQAYSGFAGTFGSEYASVKNTTTDQNFLTTGTAKKKRVEDVEATKARVERAAKRGNFCVFCAVYKTVYIGSASTTIKGSGPLGGEVATGENAQEEFVKGVARESEALGSGENPLSPITS